MVHLMYTMEYLVYSISSFCFACDPSVALMGKVGGGNGLKFDSGLVITNRYQQYLQFSRYLIFLKFG